MKKAPLSGSAATQLTGSRRLLVALILLLGILPLVAFGICGVGRPAGGVINVDGTSFFAAGRAWLQGRNPYSPEELALAVAGIEGVDVSTVPFFYPPQMSIFCLPLGLMSYPAARATWVGLNLLAALAMAAIAVRTLQEANHGDKTRLGPWIVAAVVLGNPFTSHVVWMGQTSLLAGAGLVGAWFFAERGKPVIAGILLGMATFKPQLCLLLFIWFALERAYLVVIVGVATSAVMSLYGMVVQGLLGVWTAWRAGVAAGYSHVIFNSPGFQNKVGLESLLHGSGIPVPGAVLTVIGILLAVALWWSRARVRTRDVFALLVVITFVLIGFSHDYDFVCLVPLWIVSWQQASERPRAATLLAALNLLMFFPQRFLRPFQLPVLTHWRTPVLLALGIVVFALSVKLRASETKTKTKPEPEPEPVV